jgi:hypothetical protein
MFRAIAIALVILIAAGGIAASVFVVSGTGRYQFAIELELDGTRYSGATVWEMSIRATPELLPNSATPQIKVVGDAIDIPIQDGKTLFILKRNHLSPPSPAFGRNYLTCLPGDIRDDAALIATFDGSCDIKLNPKVVIADKNGVLEEVLYDGSNGHQLNIISSVATGTRAPITRGILGRHPWIAALPSDRQGSSRIPFYIEDFSRR